MKIFASLSVTLTFCLGVGCGTGHEEENLVTECGFADFAALPEMVAGSWAEYTLIAEGGREV